jgi:hypothetical protein
LHIAGANLSQTSDQIGEHQQRMVLSIGEHRLGRAGFLEGRRVLFQFDQHPRGGQQRARADLRVVVYRDSLVENLRGLAVAANSRQQKRLYSEVR